MVKNLLFIQSTASVPSFKDLCHRNRQEVPPARWNSWEEQVVKNIGPQSDSPLDQPPPPSPLGVTRKKIVFPDGLVSGCCLSLHETGCKYLFSVPSKKLIWHWFPANYDGYLWFALKMLACLCTLSTSQVVRKLWKAGLEAQFLWECRPHTFSIKVAPFETS